MRIITCVECGGKHKHHARGLCRPCYERQYPRPLIICAFCGEKKEHGAKGLCKICYNRQYYKEHRKEILVSHRLWQEKNSDYQQPMITCSGCGEEKTHNAKGLCLTCYSRFWYQENRERALAYSRRYREENPEKVRASIRRWQKDNPEKVVANLARRRAHKAKVANTLTPEQLEFERKIGEATYPGEKLHLHHLISSSKGGGHTWGNIMFIPATLNLKIRNKLPSEVYQQLAFV